MESDHVEALRRWEGSGGTWRVAVRTPAWLTVELLTCDGGEVMEHLTAPSGGELDAYVAGRGDADDAGPGPVSPAGS